MINIYIFTMSGWFKMTEASPFDAAYSCNPQFDGRHFDILKSCETDFFQRWLCSIICQDVAISRRGLKRAQLKSSKALCSWMMLYALDQACFSKSAQFFLPNYLTLSCALDFCSPPHSLSSSFLLFPVASTSFSPSLLYSYMISTSFQSNNNGPTLILTIEQWHNFSHRLN